MTRMTMINPRGWRLLCVLLLSTGAACAQPSSSSASDGQAPPAPRLEIVQAAAGATEFGDETLRWIDREMRQEQVVKGAPYCADALHESLQPLADGNRIVHRRTTRLCRDGEGRTRQEATTRDGRQAVYLRDPVAGESWVLDPQRKTARRSLGAVMGHIEGSEGPAAWDGAIWRDYAERMREWARQLAERVREAARPGAAPAPPAPPAPPVPPVPPPSPAAAPSPEPVVITRDESTDAQGRRRDVEIRVLRLPRDGHAPMPMPGMSALPPLPPPVGYNAARLAPRGPGIVMPLPPRDIEGVRAHGVRTTWTIDAGKVGNEKPIVITREVWTSPELMLTLSSRDFDPRTGEVSYRLHNLRRDEPDAALMKVPADYDTGRKAIPRPPPPGTRG